MKSGVVLKNLKVGYNGKVLYGGLTVRLREGEFWVVVGPNGVGKSTLIKTILGIIPPISGRILIHGVDCTNGCDEKRFLSYVPQMEDYSHDFPSTALDIVISGLLPRMKRFQFPGESERRMALNCMETLDIDDFTANRSFNKLSGGQQKKVLIARALVSEPHYLFLDEPTTGVDIKSSRKIIDIIYKLNKKKKFGIFMVTHDLNFVWPYIDKVILIGESDYFVGTRDEIVNSDLLSKIYGVSVRVIKTAYSPVFLIGDKHV